MDVDRGFPCPDESADLAGFVRALRDVKLWSGNPSLETLRRRTGIAKSTLADAFSMRRRRLPSLEIVRAVVGACGAGQPEAARWEHAWRALAERLDAAVVPPPTHLPVTAWIPRQLPPDVAGFAGRTEALNALAAGETAPITVITGTAGVGKTALTVHWAHRIAGRYPDGQLHLDLRGHSADPTISPAEALPALLQALGVPVERIPADQPAQIGLYRSVLAGRRVLVVLDNVVNTAHVRPLLPSGAGCHALITSRDALTGLVVRDGAARITLDTMDRAEAAALLGYHLGADRVSAEPAAAAELAALCAHLPLALRIVAANLAARPGHTIAGAVRELRDCDLLGRLQVVGDPETAVAAALDVSYRALPAQAQRLFRMLALVPGPEVNREAAAALLGHDPGDPVPEIDELVAAHMLAEVAPDRFRCHDLLSLYARRRAAEDTEPVRDQARHRLFSWYFLSADAARQTFKGAPSESDWSTLALVGRGHRFDGPNEADSWFQVELANLTAAVTHAADHGPAPFAWQLVRCLASFLNRRDDGLTMLGIARVGLRAAEEAGDIDGRLHCHMALAGALTNLGHLSEAVEAGIAARELALRTGDDLLALRPTTNLGDAYLRMGDIKQAVRLFREVMVDERPATSSEALNLSNLALIERIRGRHAEALRLDAACLDFSRRAGDPLLTSSLEVSTAMTHLEGGDPATAEPLLRRAYVTAAEAGSETDRYDILAALILCCARTGRLAEAETWIAALRDLLDRGVTSYIGDDWAHAAIVETHLTAGRPEQALADGVPALREHERIGYQLSAMRLRILLGQAHLMLGETAEARAMWAAALPYAQEQDLPDRARLEALLTGTVPGRSPRGR